ncbi:hypothetical protein IBX38_08230 [Candidatus Bathyarchaeota archaeon]|nr:hypothetical protein [Candidatus Bathyarchaeota archaeon]
MVRLVPEVLSFPYPIGFDTVYYAARMKSGVVWYHWSSLFSTWLVYAVLVPLYSLTEVDPFLLLKVIGPLLYGGSAAGIYYFAWRGLSWGVKKCLFASIFFAFQLAALGISWHFYRNLFGLMLLLFALPFLKKTESWKELALLAVLSLLVVLGHEYASVAMLAMVLGLVASSFLKREKMPYRVLMAILPALIVFVGSIYFRMFPASFRVETNIIRVNDGFNPHPGGLFFLVDYLSVVTPVDHYASYFELVSNVVSLFALLYLVWLPLVLVGFFRDKILDGWATLLLVGSFGCLVVPFCALEYWHRWMLMLVYPFTFYAVNGFWRVLKSRDTWVASGLRWMSWMKISRKSAIGISGVTVLLGSLFMTWPLISGRYGLLGASTTWKYFPSTMQSSSVPLQDTEGTVKAIEWLNGHMTDGSAVLVHDVFFYWNELYLDEDHTAILFTNNLEEASSLALENGFSSVYFVWWNEDIGWYGLTVPSDFVSVFESGRISVFQIL